MAGEQNGEVRARVDPVAQGACEGALGGARAPEEEQVLAGDEGEEEAPDLFLSLQDARVELVLDLNA